MSRHGRSSPPPPGPRSRAAPGIGATQGVPPADRSDHVARDAAGNLLITGRVAGPIVHDSDVTVGPAGHVDGIIRARAILVEGQVAGDLHAKDSIRVSATGRVYGDLHAARLGVAAGAQLCGRFVMPRRTVRSLDLDASGVDMLLGG